jgi:hypothetical protein
MAQVPSYVPTNGLVGWWPFNGNANDESGNGNNGTVNGATLTTDRFGNTGKAYSFDGVDDFIKIPSSSTLDNINLATFNFWMKSSQLTNAQLFKKGDSQSISNAEQISSQININNQNQSGFATKFNSNCESGAGWVNNYSNEIIVNNYWYMITGVIKNDSTLYYINGSLISSILTPNSTMDICNGGPINLGRNWDNDPDQYNGILDDLGFWNRALTQQEITDLYNANICYEYVTVTDTLVINTGITGYNPITYLNTLKIWPNPSNDHITIDAGDLTTMNGYSIKIEDAQGQQVFQNAVNQQQFYIDITSWGGNGLYFVRIIDPQGNTVDIKKIVLQ